jgi:hypothetical protein
MVGIAHDPLIVDGSFYFEAIADHWLARFLGDRRRERRGLATSGIG